MLILFSILVVAVTAFGMTAVFFGLFSAENVGIAGIPRGVDEGFWDSMWWALTYVLRLPALSAMYGATATVLIYAVTLSIFGLAVFGILVSLIDNAMRGRIERLREGHTPVKERGHLLLLGWNKKVVSVLRQLARLQPGARVAILATREVSEMSQTLRVAGIARERITVILRTGVPSNIDELERMAIDHASGVIILSNPADDSAAIKTLVILAAREHWPGKRPTLTAEIAEEQNYGLAEIAAKNRLHVVSTSRVTSKIIVQTIRNPGLARVYDELMSTDGNYIRAEHVQACIGKTVREIAYGFNDAIPIGITWEEDDDSGTTQHKAALNPEPDYDLAEGEHLVLLQRSGTARYAPRAAAYTSSVFNARTGTPVVPLRILLIGWSDIAYDILLELNAHVTSGTTVTVLASPERSGVDAKLSNDVAATLTKLKVDLRRGDAAERSAYENLDLASYDTIVVLADEAAGNGDSDSHALRISLRLSALVDQTGAQANIVVELLDAANRDLYRGLGIRDLVVSSDVISAQLAQITQQEVLGSIYRELLSAGGVEISLRAAVEYVIADTPCRFEDLIFAAQKNSEIALGLSLDSGEVLLNPSREDVWQLGEHDKLIVLAQQIYR